MNICIFYFKAYLDTYEKASVASFCGYLQALLPVCKTWEDALWAYMRVMIDIRVESEIRDSVHRNYQQLTDSYWDQKYCFHNFSKFGSNLSF